MKFTTEADSVAATDSTSWDRQACFHNTFHSGCWSILRHD